MVPTLLQNIIDLLIWYRPRPYIFACRLTSMEGRFKLCKKTLTCSKPHGVEVYFDLSVQTIGLIMTDPPRPVTEADIQNLLSDCESTKLKNYVERITIQL